MPGLMAVSPETVRRWLRSGAVQAVKTPGGREYRIPESQVPREAIPQAKPETVSERRRRAQAAAAEI